MRVGVESCFEKWELHACMHHGPWCASNYRLRGSDSELHHVWNHTIIQIQGWCQHQGALVNSYSRLRVLYPDYSVTVPCVGELMKRSTLSLTCACFSILWTPYPMIHIDIGVTCIPFSRCLLLYTPKLVIFGFANSLTMAKGP